MKSLLIIGSGLLVGLIAAGVLGAPSPTATKKPVGPLPPSEARASVEMEPGLDCELVAFEPMIESPCAIAWDERGRCFVAENIGYPTGGPNGNASGSIALLEDTEGDGLPHKRTTYVKGLSYPNGVMPWRGGLIVTCAPDVLYFKDSKGDGQVDVREVLLSGFDTGGSTQLRVNDPKMGPDGWIYLSGGLVGGVVYSPKHPEHKVNSGKGDIRFKPDTGEIELVDGKGQYEQTFDDAGHRFVCMNRIQVQHAPLPAKYIARNPKVTPPGVLQSCPDLILNTLLIRGQNSGSRVYPISANITTADSHAGTYTAACGITVARGDSLPKDYVGVAWSCEPTGNLARCDELVPTGGSFHATRMHEGTEAFRSKDDWCRPVFLADGPDGALYICDMYRRIIEHPEYLPEELRLHGDFTGGKTMGRIWRVSGASFNRQILGDESKATFTALAKADSAEKLVALLASKNGWTRDTAFRLITERGVSEAVKPLAKMFGEDAPVATRMACLHLLRNAGALTDEQIATAMASDDSSMREVGVGLSEPRLGSSSMLAGKVLAMAEDPAVHVRYAVALAAGDIPDRGKVVKALEKIAAKDADDKWFRAAILTSLPSMESQWDMLTSLASKPLDRPGSEELLRGLVRVLNAGASDEVLAENLKKIDPILAKADYPTRVAILLGYGERGGAQLRSGGPEALKATLAQARTTATDSKAPADARARAATLLGLSNEAENEKALLALVSPEQPQDVATAAARAIATPQHVDAVGQMLDGDHWGKYSPVLRGAIISSIIGRPELAKPLLDAMEAKSVPLTAINPPQRDWLKKLSDEKLRAQADRLLANGGVATDRQKTYEETKALVMPLKSNPVHGQKVFRDNCTSCHRLDREGVAVGPDLLDIRSLPKETILLHIVIPELEIAPNFTCYNCTTKDGRTITGIMIADTPTAITLRQPLAVEETIQRDQIQTLEASKLSLMPQGLEKVVGPQDMADLLGYLRGEK